MTEQSYVIRNMSRAELDIAVEWARAEGWNPGLYDADCFYAADPGGFFMGFLGDEPIACISAVAYGSDFGFLGFYIVKPEYRGMGYGIKIWHAGMEYLKGRNVGLDGVVDQQDNYRKSGYSLAYRNIRYAGAAQNYAIAPGIVDAAQADFESIMALDAELFPTRREEFMRCWIRRPEGKALFMQAGAAPAAFGVIRHCFEGYKIGPLYAQNPEQAGQMYRALAAQVSPGATVYLDTPECNPAAVELAHSYSMERVFETARMYTGPVPRLQLQKLFGVCTFELG